MDPGLNGGEHQKHFLGECIHVCVCISANRGRLAMDNCEISTVGELTGSLADTFSKVQELDLTKNLISDWNQVRVD